ncbi:AMP-binding protein [Spirillospora sp. CA-255316]
MKGSLLPGVELGRRSPCSDLVRAENERPGRLLLRSPAGDHSVGGFADLARRCAQHLRATGVAAGDRVALISGNSVERLAWQYGIWWIGAVEVSVNCELRGPMLQFVLENCEPSLLVVERETAAEMDLPRTAATIVIDEVDLAPVTPDAAARLDSHLETMPPSALGTILYTSGTTGASKGVMLPRAYFSNLGAVMAGVLELKPGDVGYFVLPFFHVDAHIVLPACIQSGSALAFDRRFSARRWWPQIRDFQATWAFVIGAVLSVVMTLEHGGRGDTRLTRFLGAPIPEDAYPFFEDDLGIAILSMFGQTEADGPTFETMSMRRRGSAGTPCAGFDVEIHDPGGRRVPDGSIGEIVIRPQYPDMTALGYWRRDDAMVEAVRGLWFHTGDLGRMEDGFLTFVGRLTDSLRRRGENISAYELEAVLNTAPGVAESAVIGVTDEMGGEDEIKVFVVPEDPGTFDVADFFRFCERTLPRYAVPSLLEITEAAALVRSVGTGVIQKRRLSPRRHGAGVFTRETSAVNGMTGDRTADRRVME